MSNSFIPPSNTFDTVLALVVHMLNGSSAGASTEILGPFSSVGEAESRVLELVGPRQKKHVDWFKNRGQEVVGSYRVFLVPVLKEVPLQQESELPLSRRIRP